MGKLVVFKLGDGSFEQGFPVTLQIGDDGLRPSIEITGKLPPAPEIRLYSSRWATAYRRLGARFRLEAKVGIVTNVSKIENCSDSAQLLSAATNAWLHSESFRSVRDKFLEQLMPTDEIRVIIQTEDIGLRRLPWHLWDLCARYPKAEIALSVPEYEHIPQEPSPKNSKVKILAILGNSVGINTQADRLLLEQLPDAEVSFLVEPEFQELTEKLWMQGWDILFFAGHSSSQADGETGLIYINQNDSLTIEQLKYGLKKAVKRGLKIAIFNSCDGLGLARNLADLQIPQITIMREPVPDRVAQEFLKSFLGAFACNKSFYLSVREARERLQGLEDQFPCATWLPMICQNPAEVPPTWQELRGEQPDSLPNNEPVKPISNNRLRAVFLATVVITSVIMGVRYLGMLQPLELQAFDQITRLRADEKRDPRLLVVAVTDNDLQLPEQNQRTGSLSDLALNRLLEKLEQYQPRVIGLDIYREEAVDRKYPNLATRLRRNERFIAVCKVTDPEADPNGYQPPPEVPTERLGFSDFVIDPDHIVRRHLLSLTPDPASPCTTHYAFSVQLAFRYLAAQGILPKYTSDGYLQLGNVVFKPLEAHTGGYQGIDAGGYQVLLNYRSPQNVAAQVTLTDILSGQINPNSVKDRIVLIGTTANKFKDYWFTPYSNGLWPDQPGVILQAQMVSQILSAVLDHRPLLWVLPFGGEIIFVWGWSVIGATLAWRLQSPLKLGLAVGATLGCLYGFCFIILVQSSCWVPLVGSALALIATSSSVAVYTYQTRSPKIPFQSLKGT